MTTNPNEPAFRSIEKEIGRIIARLISKDVTLPVACRLIDEQLKLLKLEAYKAGLTRAAEICAKSGQCGEDTECQRCNQSHWLKQEIINHHDQLKELPEV